MGEDIFRCDGEYSSSVSVYERDGGICVCSDDGFSAANADLSIEQARAMANAILLRVGQAADGS